MEEAARLGYEVVDLDGDLATPENLTKALGENGFSALFLGGHGSPTTFTGQDGKVVFEACKNDEVLAGNLAFYLSCFVGQELAVSNVSKGLVAFIGYNSDFRFIIDTSYPVLEDPMAEPFRDSVVEVVARILRGDRVIDVWNGGVAVMNQWLRVLSARAGTEWSDVISFLTHDRDAFIALGDTFAYTVRPVSVSGLGFAFAPLIGGVLLMAGLPRGKR